MRLAAYEGRPCDFELTPRQSCACYIGLTRLLSRSVEAVRWAMRFVIGFVLGALIVIFLLISGICNVFS